MKAKMTRKGLAFAAGATTLALALSACSSSGTPTTSGEPGGTGGTGEQITLTLATFNNFGYTDELLQEYMDANPNIKIVHNRVAESGDARSNFMTKLGVGGGGLSDIEAIEVDWFPEAMQYADFLADLSSPDVEGRWLDWKAAAATDADGRLVGYGTDIGPEAICYRGDLFAAAGLPSDPAEVAALLSSNGGGWDQYFAVGKQYQAGGGGAWFDSIGGTFQGMINQVAVTYEDPATGELLEAPTAEVKAIFDQLTAVTELSTGYGQWSGDWFAAMGEGGFATMLCPGWMLGVIKDSAAGVDGWNVADVFPGGGGNWGGSYLTVPASGKNVEEAKKLAAWLTAPEQQLKALSNAGTFPSQLAALNDTDALNAAMAVGDPSNASFFSSDELGTIFGNRAAAITVTPFKGAHYSDANGAISSAIGRVDEGVQDAATAWDQALTDFAALR